MELRCLEVCEAHPNPGQAIFSFVRVHCPQGCGQHVPRVGGGVGHLGDDLQTVKPCENGTLVRAGGHSSICLSFFDGVSKREVGSGTKHPRVCPKRMPQYVSCVDLTSLTLGVNAGSSLHSARLPPVQTGAAFQPRDPPMCFWARGLDGISRPAPETWWSVPRWHPVPTPRKPSP